MGEVCLASCDILALSQKHNVLQLIWTHGHSTKPPHNISCLFLVLITTPLLLSPAQQCGIFCLMDDLHNSAVDSEHYRHILKTYMFTVRYEALSR